MKRGGNTISEVKSESGLNAALGSNEKTPSSHFSTRLALQQLIGCGTGLRVIAQYPAHCARDRHVELHLIGHTMELTRRSDAFGNVPQLGEYPSERLTTRKLQPYLSIA
jgi:hypothetical protein